MFYHDIFIENEIKKDSIMLSNDFNEKMLAADIFEVKKTSEAVKKLWQDAKDIEITLDFMQPKGFLSKILKIFAKNH